MVVNTADTHQCQECLRFESPVSRIFQGWDKCEVCEGQLVPNPEYIMPHGPRCLVKGGSTFKPALSPEQVKVREGRKLRARKKEILKGPGTVVEKDLAVTKLTLESRADEYKSGAFEFDVPRLMDAKLKPEMPKAFIPVCSPEKSA